MNGLGITQLNHMRSRRTSDGINRPSIGWVNVTTWWKYLLSIHSLLEDMLLTCNWARDHGITLLQSYATPSMAWTAIKYLNSYIRNGKKADFNFKSTKSTSIRRAHDFGITSPWHQQTTCTSLLVRQILKKKTLYAVIRLCRIMASRI